MAAVTKVDPSFMSPPAEGSHIIRGLATVDLAKGDVVMYANSAFDTRYDCALKKQVAEVFFDAIVVAPAKAGQAAEAMVTGEFDGYSGLTPGDPLTAANGSLDTTAPAAGAPAQVKALSATKIIKTF
jgi:hypothetical protein